MVENKFTIRINQSYSTTNKVNVNNKIPEINYQTDEIIDKSNFNTSFPRFSLEIINQSDSVLHLSLLTSYLNIQNLLSHWNISKSIKKLETIFNSYTELLNKFIELLSTLKNEKVCDKVQVAIQKSEIKVSNEKGSFTKSKEFPNFKTFAKRLIIDLLKVLEDPNLISQENKGTCGQTSIERAIVEDNKTQYIDTILQFLTKGYYQKDPNSPKIELNTGGIINNPDIEGNDERLLTTRIITPSLVEYANQQEYNDTYNDDLDKTEKRGIVGSYSEPTLKAVTGKEYKTTYIGNLNNSKKTSILKKVLEESTKYPVIIYTQSIYGGSHAVRLLDIDENKIVVSNPWGQIETFKKGKEKAEVKGREGKEFEIHSDYEKYLSNIDWMVAPMPSIKIPIAVTVE